MLSIFVLFMSMHISFRMLTVAPKSSFKHELYESIYRVCVDADFVFCAFLSITYKVSDCILARHDITCLC